MLLTGVHDPTRGAAVTEKERFIADFRDPG